MKRNFIANSIVTAPGIGDKIHDVYSKLPGVVRVGTSIGRFPVDSYIRWLISMGMYETLNMLTGLEIEYGR